MTTPIKKVIDIIHDLFTFGKRASKGIQISGDIAIARRIKKAVAKGDVAKIKKIVERGGILIDGKDFVGILKPRTAGEPNLIIITEDMLVSYVWMKKIIKRLQRKGD